MLLETFSSDFRKARSVNATDTSFPSKIPTSTAPAGDAGTATGASVIELSKAGQGVKSQNGVVLVPYGTGDDNDVFAMRVIGWRRIKGDANAATPTLSLWIPVVLAELTCTMSATVGVAGTPVVATERFVDTIVLVTGNDDVSIDIVSPLGDEIGHVLMDLKGFQKLELTFDMTTGDPTGANCLIALL